jgi:hypothetical protein
MRSRRPDVSRALDRALIRRIMVAAQAAGSAR